MGTRTDTEVLIIGAGPTGLVLAIELARRGVAFRLIDQATEPGTTSRALAVQARTLEFYQALGFADEVVAAGREMKRVNLWIKGRDAGSVRLGDAGQDLSPFPFVLVFPQDEHERFLIQKLEALGKKVERGQTLVALEQGDESVTATLRLADGSTETLTAAYLCGCDGAHSAARKLLDITFPGGTYGQPFFVADVIAEGPTADNELHACPGRGDVCLVFPMEGQGHVRLVGLIPKGVDSSVTDQAITFEHVRGFVAERASLTVTKVLWFSPYRVHHRVAETFERGQCYLLGDAGHIHSPVGGQGMNTGIGDAANLAWKLADVLKRSAPASLLATYSAERITFARELVSTTDRLFTRLIDPSPLGSFFRLQLIGVVLPMITKVQAVRRMLFERVSQIGIEYRSSGLSRGQAGSIQAGDRLPWVPTGPGTSNFDPLHSLDWQAHVYGGETDELNRYCTEIRLPLEVFPFNEAASNAGLASDALYLIRPDGYVGLASPSQDVAALRAYRQEILGATS